MNVDQNKSECNKFTCLSFKMFQKNYQFIIKMHVVQKTNKQEKPFKKTKRQVDFGMNVDKNKSECNKVTCLSFKMFQKIINLLSKCMWFR